MHALTIHAEYDHPWEPTLAAVGVVTAASHHVHHVRPKRNLGHTFTYWDRMMGTYLDPANCSDPGVRRRGLGSSENIIQKTG